MEVAVHATNLANKLRLGTQSSQVLLLLSPTPKMPLAIPVQPIKGTESATEEKLEMGEITVI